MAISGMSKILIAGHLTEFEPFIDDLQHRSIFHPDEFSNTLSARDESFSTSHIVSTQGTAQDRRNLAEVCDYLEPYRPGSSLYQRLTHPRICITRSRYRNITKTFNIHQFLETADHLKNRIEALNRQRETIEQENQRLKPWKNVDPPVDVLPSLSRLKDKGIGEEKTREDHADLSNQLFAAYAKGKEIQELAVILGESALSELDRIYFSFAENFERRYVSQGYRTTRTVYETLDLGWQLLRVFPTAELKMIRLSLLEKYFVSR